MAKRGIGRGLAAILPDSPAPGDELRELPVEMIRPNPPQPRRRFDAEAITALAESIAAAGVVQPLLVHPLRRRDLRVDRRRAPLARGARGRARDGAGDPPRRGRDRRACRRR